MENYQNTWDNNMKMSYRCGYFSQMLVNMHRDGRLTSLEVAQLKEELSKNLFSTDKDQLNVVNEAIETKGKS